MAFDGGAQESRDRFPIRSSPESQLVSPFSLHDFRNPLNARSLSDFISTRFLYLDLTSKIPRTLFTLSPLFLDLRTPRVARMRPMFQGGETFMISSKCIKDS